MKLNPIANMFRYAGPAELVLPSSELGAETRVIGMEGEAKPHRAVHPPLDGYVDISITYSIARGEVRLCGVMLKGKKWN